MLTRIAFTHGPTHTYRVNLCSHGVPQLFRTFDKDNSGTISWKELQGAMKKLGTSLSKSDARTMLKSVDDDGNGAIDFEEFLSLVDLYFTN